MNGIPAEWGTAVTVQSMVFGNMGDDSGTGVAFTRNPANGADEFYGEFLVNAQGEDVVAGIRTPQKIRRAGGALAGHRAAARGGPRAPRAALPRHAGHRVHHRARASSTCSRPAPGSGPASPRCGSPWRWRRRSSSRKEEAVLRVDPEALNHLLRPVFDGDRKARRRQGGQAPRERAPRRPRRGDAAGSSSSPRTPRSGARGARRWSSPGTRPRPEDIRGMAAAEGFLTAFGGMTSHAALVARQMGKVAIVGCDALRFDYHARDDDRGDARGRRRIFARGRLDLDRRHRGRGASRASSRRSPPRWSRCSSRGRATRRAPRSTSSSRSSSAGPTGPAPPGARQRRPARPGGDRGRVRRRRASACAAPSTCSSARGRSARCAR